MSCHLFSRLWCRKKRWDWIRFYFLLLLFVFFLWCSRCCCWPAPKWVNHQSAPTSTALSVIVSCFFRLWNYLRKQRKTKEDENYNNSRFLTQLGTSWDSQPFSVCRLEQASVSRCLFLSLWWTGEFRSRQSNPWLRAFRSPPSFSPFHVTPLATHGPTTSSSPPILTWLLSPSLCAHLSL